MLTLALWVASGDCGSVLEGLLERSLSAGQRHIITDRALVKV